jgi:hypothetical protein
VIVVGSQAILGSFREDELPADATMSVEVDILPIADSNDETARLADLMEGVAGEFSTFEELHGFSIDGVDLETSALPDRWRDRLVQVQNANTAASAGQPQFTGWCLDKEDLSVSPSSACSERRIATSLQPLLEAGLVDAGLILERLPSVEERRRPDADRAVAWLESWKGVV